MSEKIAESAERAKQRVCPFCGRVEQPVYKAVCCVASLRAYDQLSWGRMKVSQIISSDGQS